MIVPKLSKIEGTIVYLSGVLKKDKKRRFKKQNVKVCKEKYELTFLQVKLWDAAFEITIQQLNTLDLLISDHISCYS